LFSLIFDLEEERLKAEISKRKAKRVLIQLPEGLKPVGPRLAEIVEEAGALPIVSADPCYGACDIAISEAKNLKADLIIHYGHTEAVKAKIPTVYVEARAKVDVSKILEKALENLSPWSRIGIATTVQHIHMLDVARKILTKAGKTVIIGDAGHVKYPGQVIGCDYSNAEAIADDVEAFLFIGGGKFHAIGLALATMKPIIAVDPFENRIHPIADDVKRILKQRFMCISEAKEAESFGVLVGLKIGQIDMKAAMRIREYLKEDGKKVTMLAIREITPESLMEFPSIDAYINTACPRVAIDDASRFHKPILTTNEALVMLGKISWETLLNKGWFKHFI